MSREIICADAIEWLKENKCDSIFTSPPDADELGVSIEEWSIWFMDALRLCIRNTSGPVVFYVTDRRKDGQTHSKASMVFDAANSKNAKVTWHKICLKKNVGKVDLHRPTYSHLISLNGKPKKATPDVIPCGKSLYRNGTGINAAVTGVKWIMGQADAIVDPFCGRGVIPAVADCLGIESFGIDIDAEQCRHAELTSVDAEKFVDNDFSVR